MAMAVPPRRRRRRKPRVRTRASGSAAQRGYGAGHRRLRAAAIAAYVPGVTLCWRCGRPIADPPRRVHLGHDDDDRRIYRGLEHASCNTAAAQAAQNRKRAAPGRETGSKPREW